MRGPSQGMQLVLGSALRRMSARRGELVRFQSRPFHSPLSLEPLLLLAEFPLALAEIAALVLLQAGSKSLCIAFGLIRERASVTFLRMPQTTLVNSDRAAVLAPGENGRQGSIVRYGLPGPKAKECTAAQNHQSGASEKAPPPGHITFTIHAYPFLLQPGSRPTCLKQDRVLTLGKKAAFAARLTRNVAFSC